VDRPPHTRRKPRIREGTSRVSASGVLRQFILALLFTLLLAGSSTCGILPMPGTAQPPPSGSLVVSYIDVGQGDAVLIQSGGKTIS
jgi:beta-lactamase superfamily II metal-dependent hydrolase